MTLQQSLPWASDILVNILRCPSNQFVCGHIFDQLDFLWLKVQDILATVRVATRSTWWHSSMTISNQHFDTCCMTTWLLQVNVEMTSTSFKDKRRDGVLEQKQDHIPPRVLPIARFTRRQVHDDWRETRRRRDRGSDYRWWEGRLVWRWHFLFSSTVTTGSRISYWRSLESVWRERRLSSLSQKSYSCAVFTMTFSTAQTLWRVWPVHLRPTVKTERQILFQVINYVIGTMRHSSLQLSICVSDNLSDALSLVLALALSLLSLSVCLSVYQSV